MKTDCIFTLPFDSTAPLRVDTVCLVWQDDQIVAMGDGDEFYAEGCYAEAQVSYPIGQGCRRTETFSSGGLWGIDADSSPEYKREIEQEQLADLREHLARFGIAFPNLPHEAPTSAK